jgi:hypothetical protein
MDRLFFQPKGCECAQGRFKMICVAAFWVASYVMLRPVTPVTLKVDDKVVVDKLELTNLQLPVLPVTHVLAPPGLKVPLTVALGTAAPVLTSRIATVAPAVQLLPVLLEPDTNDFTATTCWVTAPGAPAKAYTKTFGEPVPADVTWFMLPLVLRKLATSVGVAFGLAAKAKTAVPVTCGAAMEVPDKIAAAFDAVYQAEVMLEPGANKSKHVP